MAKPERGPRPGPGPGPRRPPRPPRPQPERGPGPRRAPAGRGLGGEQVEGRQAVAELLRARRRRVRDVWVAAEIDPAPIVEEILALAEAARVPVRRVARSRLDAASRTEAPQGVLAHADPLPEADFDDLCRPARDGTPPLLVAFDGVTDPQNLGALLRSAEAAGATGAVLPRHRSVHVTPAAAKAAAGAVERVPMAVVAGLPAALARATEAGVWVVGLTTEGGENLWRTRLGDGPVLVVVGAEGPGLSRLVRQRCDVLVTIPLDGALASLNVSAAGAIALFELARQRHESKS
ncbi:MAG: 23S rRNA (guanosine(2251)-2'-O)-methyltransferase RlmB [Acidimicrobiia bacterium]